MNLSLPALICLWLSLVLSPVALGSDYIFKDPNGNEVVLPSDLPVYDERNPGPWKEVATMHRPEIKARMRKQGLEAVRIVTMKFNHAADNEKDGYIKAVYILDKDHIVIGYAKLKPQQDEPVEFRLNGNINLVQVYVECTKHALWHSLHQFI